MHDRGITFAFLFVCFSGVSYAQSVSDYEALILGPWTVHAYKQQTGFKRMQYPVDFKFHYSPNRKIRIVESASGRILQEGTFSLAKRTIKVGTEPTSYRDDLYIKFSFDFSPLCIQAGDEVLLEVRSKRIDLSFFQDRTHHLIKLRQYY